MGRRKKGEDVSGWVVLDKPDDMTSTQAVSAVRRIFNAPAHPYTRALIESIPKLGENMHRLTAIDGQPPDLAALPPGCSFAPRCGQVMDHCRAHVPPPLQVASGHVAGCWLHGGVVKAAAS